MSTSPSGQPGAAPAIYPQHLRGVGADRPVARGSLEFCGVGAAFGVLLTAEKLFLDKWLQKCGRILPHVYVMAVVVLSFVLFNASSMQGALADIAAVLGLTGAPFAGELSLYYLKSYAVLLAVSAVGCTPWPRRLALALPEGVKAFLEPLAMAVLLLLVTAYLVDGSFNPFLYFAFERGGMCK